MDTILLGYSIFLKVSGPMEYSLKVSGLLYLYLLKYKKSKHKINKVPLKALSV